MWWLFLLSTVKCFLNDFLNNCEFMNCWKVGNEGNEGVSEETNEKGILGDEE